VFLFPVCAGSLVSLMQLMVQYPLPLLHRRKARRLAWIVFFTPAE
jgi:hypothetical protein